jgi:Central domain of human glycogen debranching enzyme
VCFFAIEVGPIRTFCFIAGSMDRACLTSIEALPSPTGTGPVRTCVISPLIGSLPHALFYDLTHDNESLLDKRSAEDALSTGALVAFSYSAIGSVKGFDDLYPKLLNLVNEKRMYRITGLGDESGISRIKRVLNGLHMEMVIGGYEEGHVHQENDVRHNLSISAANSLIAVMRGLVHYCTSRAACHSERVLVGCPYSFY